MQTRRKRSVPVCWVSNEKEIIVYIVYGITIPLAEQRAVKNANYDRRFNSYAQHLVNIPEAIAIVQRIKVYTR